MLLALFAYYAEQGLCICRAPVRLSVCHSIGHNSKLCAVALSAGDIDRLLHGGQQHCVLRANTGSAKSSAYVVAEHSLVYTEY